MYILKLDELLNDIKWKNFFQFTYIGNIPNKFRFKNIRHIEPCHGKKLANEIKKTMSI